MRLRFSDNCGTTRIAVLRRSRQQVFMVRRISAFNSVALFSIWLCPPQFAIASREPLAWRDSVRTSERTFLSCQKTCVLFLLVDREHVRFAAPSLSYDQAGWPRSRRKGNSQLLQDQNSYGGGRSSERSEREHQSPAAKRTWVQGFELFALKGTALGSHEDRIRGFSESRLKCALLQILVQKGLVGARWI